MLLAALRRRASSLLKKDLAYCIAAVSDESRVILYLNSRVAYQRLLHSPELRSLIQKTVFCFYVPITLEQSRHPIVRWCFRHGGVVRGIVKEKREKGRQ